MAKFIVTLVVETREGKSKPAPTKRSMKESIEGALYVESQTLGWQLYSRQHTLKRARVRSVDLD